MEITANEWLAIGIGTIIMILFIAGILIIHTHGGLEAISRKFTGVRVDFQNNPKLLVVHRGIFLLRGKEILGGWYQSDWEKNPNIVFEIVWAVCLAFRGFRGLWELEEVRANGTLREERDGHHTRVANMHQTRVLWNVGCEPSKFIEDKVAISNWEMLYRKIIYISFPKRRWIEDPAFVYDLIDSLVLAIIDMKGFAKRHQSIIAEDQRLRTLDRQKMLNEGISPIKELEEVESAES